MLLWKDVGRSSFWWRFLQLCNMPCCWIFKDIKWRNLLFGLTNQTQSTFLLLDLEVWAFGSIAHKKKLTRVWPQHSIHDYPAKGYILERVLIISQMSTLCIERWNVWPEAEPASQWSTADLKLLRVASDHINRTCNLSMPTLSAMWRSLSTSVNCSGLFLALLLVAEA